MMPPFKSILTQYPKQNTIAAPPAPPPANLKPEDKPPIAPAQNNNTYWMRPPTGTATEEGLMPGDDGYVDPHAETMNEWEDINKQKGFKPDGSVYLHSESESGRGEEEGGNYQGTGKKHRGTGDRARLAANKTQGQSATILTE
jgi:hypothetical protein